MMSAPGTGAGSRDLAQSPTGADPAGAAATPGSGAGTSQRSALFDADEHTRTRAILDRRELWLVVNADDARLWPPVRPAVVTRTWCQIKGLLPW